MKTVSSPCLEHEKESLECLLREERSAECRPLIGADVGLAVLCREKPPQVTSESLGFSPGEVKQRAHRPASPQQEDIGEEHTSPLRMVRYRTLCRHMFKRVYK